jgi:hypothetical protein
VVRKKFYIILKKHTINAEGSRLSLGRSTAEGKLSI